MTEALDNRNGSRLATADGGDVETFLRIERFLGSISDLDHLLEVIIAEARDVTLADAGSLLLYDAATDELYFDVALGRAAETDVQRMLKRIRVKRGEGIAGAVAQTLAPLSIRDAQHDPRLLKLADKQSGFVTESLLAVPMVRGGKLLGVLEVLNKRGGGGFTERDEKILTVIAAQAALVLENAQLYAESVRQARLSALGQGIAGAAHCIKNILNAIDGGAFILERGVGKGELDRIAKGWEILKRNMGLMRSLVLDMLTYSKDRQPEYETVDVRELCQAVAQAVQDSAAQKQVTVKVELSEQVREARLDPNGLRRCLLNLIGNGADACGEKGGDVTLRTALSSREHFFEIRVKDSGCGMSPEVQKKLFQAFFSTKGSKGTGLGLAVTHKLIREHGGEIEVQSQEGSGTEFILKLPFAPKETNG